MLLHTYEKDGGEVFEKCRELGCPDFSLAAITVPDWNGDLTPWQAAPLGREETPFGGRADALYCAITEAYRSVFTEETGA